MTVDIWELLAGLGIFLFGILLLEESVKNLSGRAFKQLIRRYTTGRLKSILSGTFATAVLQSSSAVSLMVLAFASAGIMTLESAIGVIIGSNVGTTLTSWIVATLGFKVDIESLALPFIGIGGLGLIFFGKSTRATNISRLLVGFGFLFMGLNYMKDGVDSFTRNFDFDGFAGANVFLYLFLGFALTAIVQSSSASMAIVLSMLASSVITLYDAMGMVIGTNIGTTVTVMLGTLGGQVIKKRVGYSHFFFNLITGLLTLLLLPWLHHFIGNTLGFQNDPVIGLALFHTIFNVIGVLAFFPFIPLFANFILRIVKDKTTTVSRYISTFSEEAPEAAIAAFQKETNRLLVQVLYYTVKVMRSREKLPELADGLLESDFRAKKTEKQYEDLKLLEAELYTYTARIQMQPLSHEDARAVNRYLLSLKSAMSAAKGIKDNRHHFDELDQSDNEHMQELYVTLQKRWGELVIGIFAILQEPENAVNLSQLHRLALQVNENVEEFTRSITSVISKKQLNAEEMPHPLALNRAYLLAANQVVQAVKEIIFTEHEINIYEKLEEAASETE